MIGREVGMVQDHFRAKPHGRQASRIAGPDWCSGRPRDQTAARNFPGNHFPPGHSTSRSSRGRGLELRPRRAAGPPTTSTWTPDFHGNDALHYVLCRGKIPGSCGLAPRYAAGLVVAPVACRGRGYC